MVVPECTCECGGEDLRRTEWRSMGPRNVRLYSPFNVLQPTSAVSRLTHGGAGGFDIDMPLTGTAGVECRNGGGNYTLVVTFSNTMVSGNASVTGGAGSVAGSPTFSGHTMTINLTGVTNAQTLTVSLTNLTDSFSQVLPSVVLGASFLIGDTNGDRMVNAAMLCKPGIAPVRRPMRRIPFRREHRRHRQQRRYPIVRSAREQFYRNLPRRKRRRVASSWRGQYRPRSIMPLSAPTR